jgi:hypothetical protein
MIIILWACVCIILHNLIICIKGDSFDEGWRECLVKTGLVNEQGDAEEEEEEEEDAKDGHSGALRHLGSVSGAR